MLLLCLLLIPDTLVIAIDESCGVGLGRGGGGGGGPCKFGRGALGLLLNPELPLPLDPDVSLLLNPGGGASSTLACLVRADALNPATVHRYVGSPYKQYQQRQCTTGLVASSKPVELLKGCRGNTGTFVSCDDASASVLYALLFPQIQSQTHMFDRTLV